MHQFNSSPLPVDGASAVTRLAAMVHLLEGPESPRYIRLMRRADALRSTAHVAGSSGVVATEGATSLATLAAAHSSRGDHAEAARLQSRAVEFEMSHCRRLIREWKRAVGRTERGNEAASYPEEPLLIKREDIADTGLRPPSIAGHLAVLAEMFNTLADYQEGSRNDLESQASRRKVRTLRAAIV